MTVWNARARRLARGTVSMAGLIAALAPIAAHAQSAEDAAAAINDDIIVTATKREGRLQDQPLAISAVGEAAIAQRGLDSIEDVLSSAPSFTMVPTGPSQQKVVLRGISAGGSFDAQAAATGFYLDDVPLSSSFTSSGTDLRLFDIARVEVLRGPQGTLYGGGSMGGAVKIVTNQPDASEATARIEAGLSTTRNSAAGVELNAMANVPLVEDTLALRIVGVYRYQQGFVRDAVTRNRAGGADIKGVRAAIRWTPSSNFSLTAMGLYQESEFDGVAAIDTDRNHVPVTGDLTQTRIVPELGLGTTRVLNLVADYDFGWATLTSSSSYLSMLFNYRQDNSRYLGAILRAATAGSFGTPANLPLMGYTSSLPNTEEAFVQEVRLTSPDSGPFTWIIGGFYQYDDLVVHRLDYYDPATYLGTILARIGGSPINLDTRTRRDLSAVFGEATYALTPELKLTAGLRYSHTRNNYVSTSYGLLLGRPTIATAVRGDSTASQGHLSPKVTLSFSPNRDFMIYATVAEGFRPGGPNLLLPPDPTTGLNTPATFDPDKLWNYEIGAKTSWFDGRLIANVSLFQMELSGLQLVATRGDRLPYIANAGDVRSRGFELELQARPTDELSISLAGAYTDDTFTDPVPVLFAQAGDRVAYVPKWAGSTSVQYRRPLSETVTGFGNLAVTYNSGAPIGYNAANGQVGVSVHAYTTADLRFGVSLRSGLEATFYVQNLTDERAETFIDSTKLGIGSNRLAVTVLQPRTFGFRLSQSF